MRVHVLIDPNLGVFECYLMPLLLNRNLLQDLGVRITILHPDADPLSEADVVVCTSRMWEGTPGPERTEKTLALLTELGRRRTRAFWLDISDSTASLQFGYLPYVEKFLKSYLLNDLTAYQRQYYQDRVYTDYYHRHFAVVEAVQRPARVLPETSDLSKIQLGWSSALGDFGALAPYLRRLRDYLPLPVVCSARFTDPRRRRDWDASFRFAVGYNRETVAFHRKKILEIGKKLNFPVDRIPRRWYMREMRHTKVAVSPFGWGEVCFRDYEAILTGAMLMKPDMSHMSTWPPLYEPNHTYVPFRWDFSDFEDVLRESLDGPKWVTIAEQAQATYRRYLLSREGREEFCSRFMAILEPWSAPSGAHASRSG